MALFLSVLCIMKYLLLLALLGVFCCKSTKSVNLNQHENTAESDFIVLKRGACFGTCPIYELTLFANGKLNYKGKAYTAYTGFYTGQIDKEKALVFFNKIKKYNWATYPEKYPVDNVDFPQFVLQYHTTKMQKEIKGNSRAAVELVELTKELDSFVKEAGLVLVE